MGLPHSFLPGEVARSADVNDNFAYIMSILGTLSTPGRIRTPSEFRMGARSNVLLTGTPDTGTNDASGKRHEFFQIGWNADYNLISGSWKLGRFLTGQGASLIRLGDGQMWFMGTDDTAGSLEGAVTTWMHIKEQGLSSYVYLPSNFSFQETNATANSLDDYRLMYTPLSTPGAIYDGAAHNAGTIIKNAKNYGVNGHAKVIAITCTIIADASSGPARVRFRQTRTSTNPKYGFTVTAGQGRYGSGFGFVPLGEGTDDNKFTVDFVNKMDSISAFIVGYFN